MRVLLAFDKFKDAIGAAEACRTAADALRETHPDWTVDSAPLADGGEGFAHVLVEAAGGRWEAAHVTGPRGTKLTVPVGFVPFSAVGAAARALLKLPPLEDDAECALLDLASASGLALLAPERRDPWHTSTAGTGELLRYAVARGAAAIILGLGGSATNDLALGALTALGWRAENAGGEPVSPAVPARWSEIVRLVPPAGLKLPPVRVACDVTNPLLGPSGAVATFGAQKGLPPETADELEQATARMATLLAEAAGADFATASHVSGAGAAGGAAFGFNVATGAMVVPGAELVAAWLDLPARIADVDLVVTGEGRFDATSLDGKGPGAVVRLATRLGKRVEIFAGRATTAAAASLPAGATLQVISPDELPLAIALRETRTRLGMAVRARFPAG